MRHSHRDSYAYRLPQPPAASHAPGSFLCVPLTALPAVSLEQRRLQHWLYRIALEEAQAVARPSLPERDLLAVWN